MCPCVRLPGPYVDQLATSLVCPDTTPLQRLKSLSTRSAQRTQSGVIFLCELGALCDEKI